MWEICLGDWLCSKGDFVQENGTLWSKKSPFGDSHSPKCPYTLMDMTSAFIIPSCRVPSPGPRWHRGWGCGWHSSFLSPHSGLPCTFPFLAPERSPSLDSPHSRETFPTALEKLKVYPSWWVFAFSETTCLDPNRKTGVWNYFEQKILLPFLTYSWVSLLISPTYSVSKPEEQRLPAYWRSTSDLRFSSPRSHINSYRSPRDSCLTPLHIHTTDEVHMWNTFPNAACVVHLSTVSLLGCSL